MLGVAKLTAIVGVSLLPVVRNRNIHTGENHSVGTVLANLSHEVIEDCVIGLSATVHLIENALLKRREL